MSERADYKPEPGPTGYYWMRWRGRYRRIWSHDVVWVAEAAWKADKVVRLRAAWEPVGKYPHAMFHGPIEPPVAPDGEKAGAPC